MFKPPCEAGVTCSIEPVEAIKIRRTNSICVRFEYFTTKAFRLLSEVGRKRALFFMSLKISRSFSFGIISSSEFKNILRLKVSLVELLKIICLHFVVFALIFNAVCGESFLVKMSTSSKTSISSSLSFVRQLVLIIWRQF